MGGYDHAGDDNFACDGVDDSEEECYDSDGHEVQEGDVVDDDGAPPPEHAGDGSDGRRIYFCDELESVPWREVHLATKEVAAARNGAAWAGDPVGVTHDAL